MLNGMVNRFDALTEEFQCFKVSSPLRRRFPPSRLCLTTPFCALSLFFSPVLVPHSSFFCCPQVDCSGDTYIAVSGHEGGTEIDRAEAAMELALGMVEAIKKVQYPQAPDKHLQVRKQRTSSSMRRTPQR